MACSDLPAKNGTPGRLDWVDALRGLAVIAVVVVHVAYGFPALGRTFVMAASAGSYGVDLFFVISGFVLYHTYRRLAERVEKPRRIFLFRRWARLAPVYYAGIVAYGYLQLPASDGAANGSSVLLNLFFLNGWVPARANAVVPGGWSISAEAAYALFFMVIVPFLADARRAFLGWVVAWIATSQTRWLLRIAIAAVLGKWAVARDFDYLPWIHLPTFMAGVWCWHVWNRRQETGRALRPAARWFCLSAAAVIVLALPFGVWPGSDRALLAGGGSALAFYAWAAGPLPRRLVLPLAYMGRLSYGIYIIHFAVADLAQMVVVELMPAATPMWILFAGTFLMTFAASLPLAWLSWRYIEKPVQTWAGRCSRQRKFALAQP